MTTTDDTPKPATRSRRTDESRSRQLRRLREEFRAELGSEPTTADLSLVRAAALAAAMLRELEARFEAGEPVDPTAFVRIGNLHNRAMAAFRGRAVATKKPQSQEELIAELYGKKGAGNE